MVLPACSSPGLDSLLPNAPSALPLSFAASTRSPSALPAAFLISFKLEQVSSPTTFNVLFCAAGFALTAGQPVTERKAAALASAPGFPGAFPALYNPTRH